MTKINTNYSLPKTNILSALNCLRSALNSGHNARLIKMYNEDCAFPIKMENKYVESDFKKYEFNIAYISTRKEIQERTDLSDFEKYLSLNFKTCYGTQEALETYYNTGVLSAYNFKGIGRSYLVKVSDLIKFHNDKGDWEYVEHFSHYDVNKPDRRHFFDFFRLKKENDKWTVKNFKHKLWVVELLSNNEPKVKIPFMVHVLNFLAYPLKFIPKRRVLRMSEYTYYSFRVGSVTNGYGIQFQIPKKFSFN